MRLRWIDIPGDRFNAWEQIRLPAANLMDRTNFLHCPSQTAPAFASCPVVLTVHDLIPLRIDDGWSAAEASRFRKALGRSVDKARRVIAVSQFTKQDLLSEFKIPEEKVDVVHWGADVSSYNPISADEWNRVCQSYGIHPPYFVALGGDAPRKNVPRLLEALKSFVDEVNKDVQLVLLGVPEHARSKFAAIAEALNLSKYLVQLSYVPESTVARLLAKSEALLYVSLYEGFGLPILEAMAVGAPVITANVTSMPEVAGTAALLVDPLDPLSIADAMREIFQNAGIKRDLQQRGFDRVEKFTWHESAQRTLGSYLRALGL